MLSTSPSVKILHVLKSISPL